MRRRRAARSALIAAPVEDRRSDDENALAGSADLAHLLEAIDGTPQNARLACTEVLTSCRADYPGIARPLVRLRAGGPKRREGLSAAFPNGRHDDQVDSVSQLLTWRQNVWMPMQAPIVVPFVYSRSRQFLG